MSSPRAHRTYEEIEPAGIEVEELPPPRSGGPPPRWILGVLVVVVLTGSAFLLSRSFETGRSEGEVAQEDGTPEPAVPSTPEDATPEPPMPETPMAETPMAETPDPPEAPAANPGTSVAPAIPSPVPAPVAPPPVRLVPPVRTVPSAPAPRPARPQPQPPSRPEPRPREATPSPARPVQPPVAVQPTPALPVPKPQPQPPRPPTPRPVDPEEPQGSVGDRFDVTFSPAAALGSPPPIELPTDALRSGLRGRRLTVGVRVSPRGKGTVAWIHYPPGSHPFLRARAAEIVADMRFRAARENNSPVEDIVEVEIPLR